MLFREAAPPHVLVLSIGQNELQTGLARRGNVIAYVEGARAEAADRRVGAYEERLKDWEHVGNIQIPISVLTRLYPRPLEEGNPDLIESGVQVVSALYGDPSLFDDFPTTIFTRSLDD